MLSNSKMADSIFDPLRNDPFSNEKLNDQGSVVEGPNQSALYKEPQDKGQSITSDDIFGLGEMEGQDSNTTEEFDVRKNRRERQNSVSSTASQSSRLASVKSSSSLLDDPTFAPPPPRPIETDNIMTQFMAEAIPETKLPSYDKVTHSGTCLSRISLKSLLIRKWKPTFWITYGDRSLLFFKSQKHFDEWLTNKYLSEKERGKLVKLHVNFVADLNFRDVRGYQVSKLKNKWYRNLGMLRNFKLDKWYYDGGPTIAGAFASVSSDGVDDLYKLMLEMAIRSPRNKKFMLTIMRINRILDKSVATTSGGRSVTSTRPANETSTRPANAHSTRPANGTSTSPANEHLRVHDDITYYSA